MFSRASRSSLAPEATKATSALRTAAKVIARPVATLVDPTPPLAPTITIRRPVVTGRWAPAEARATREAVSSLRKTRANHVKNRRHLGTA